MWEVGDITEMGFSADKMAEVKAYVCTQLIICDMMCFGTWNLMKERGQFLSMGKMPPRQMGEGGSMAMQCA